MGTIRLVQLDPSLEKAISSDEGYRAAMAAEDWNALADAVLRIVGRTVPELPNDANRLHWGGYIAVDPDTREVIGSCAYKSAPSDEGVVEIAYHTYPMFERRGYATAMARELIALASDAPGVRRILAHTLAEPNASTRVLTKAGMEFVGDVVDPDDGRVWRWQVAVATD
jgi:RimJ/RimL family protein N-acetyltransferase